MYPGTDHFVAALRQRNPLGDFRVTPDGRDIEVKTLLDACEVGTDLWQSFRSHPEKATLVAPYAELAARWWGNEFEKRRARIREFLRPPGEYTHDSRGRVQAVEIKDQHGTPSIRVWRRGQRDLMKLARDTECFRCDKESHPALDDVSGLRAELLKYAAGAPKTLTAPAGDWPALFAQMPCLGDPTMPWSPARALTYALRLQLGILVAAVDRLAGLGESMLNAIETIAADHQGPDKLADRLAQLRTAAASYATSKHEDKKPIQRCTSADCVKCCARLVAGPTEASGDGSSGAAEPAVADLGQRPLLLDVIRLGLEGPPKESRPPPPTVPAVPAVPKPVAFVARRPSSSTKRPIARRSSSASSLDKRPRLDPTLAAAARSRRRRGRFSRPRPRWVPPRARTRAPRRPRVGMSSVAGRNVYDADQEDALKELIKSAGLDGAKPFIKFKFFPRNSSQNPPPRSALR